MRLSDEQKIDICNMYKTGLYSCNDISKIYNVSRHNIYGIVKRRKLTRNLSKSKLSRKYKLNEHYFDTIDSEEKAYFLGFLYADGYNNEKTGLIRLQLQEEDVEILEKFNTLLSSDRPLKFVDYKKKYPTWKNQYCLSINSKHMSKKLSELGCFQNKSLSLKFPTENQVSKHLLRHWLRGLWDGDGSFSAYNIKKNSYRKFCACLVSTENVCTNVQLLIKQDTDVNSCLCKANKNNTCKRLRISGRLQVKSFMLYLYNNASIYLNRKYIKFNNESL